MSTPPPENPWGQPNLPPPGAGNQPGQPQQPAVPPTAAAGGPWPPTTTAPVTPGGAGGGNKKGMWVGLGVLAVAIIGVIGFVVLRGDDDENADRGDDRRTENTGDSDEGGESDDGNSDDGGADPDDAVDVGRDFVQALIDGDCDQAADLASSDFRGSSEIEDSCGSAPDGTEVVDAELEQDSDPVVVVVTYVSAEFDDEGTFPIEMVEDDGEWFVNGLYASTSDDEATAGPEPGAGTATDGGTPAATAPSAPDGDPEEIAEDAMQAVIDGDCSLALAFGTLDFIDEYSDDVCSGELLPPDATITDVETTSDDPVVVTVHIDVDGDTIGVEVTFAEELGQFLIDSYTY